MRRLETVSQEAFNGTPVEAPAVFDVQLADGRELDHFSLIGNTPILTSSYDGHHNPQLVLSSAEKEESWDESLYYPAVRIADIHGRSLEVITSKAHIEDKYGNEYQSINIKGSDFSDPRFEKSETASRDFIVWGMQESLVIERILRSSELLRQNNIGTEYIFGLSLPEKIPYDELNTGLDLKNNTTLGIFLGSLAARFSTNPDDADEANGNSVFERRAEMIDRFKDCNYLITYRALDTPYRLGELRHEDKYEEFKQFTKQQNQEDFDADTSDYIDAYGRLHLLYWDVIPSLAENLSKMHSVGLRHGFLHANNITMLGSIVDLDSCRGEPLNLDDEPTTPEDEAFDVIDCINAVRGVVNSYKFNNEQKIYDRKDMILHRYNTTVSFLQDYLDARFELVEDKNRFLLEILKAKAKENISGDSDLNFDEMIQAAFYVFSEMNRDREIIEKIDLCDYEPIDRENTSFKEVPSNYFVAREDKILDPSWAKNDNAEEVDLSNEDVFNPTQIKLRGIVAKSFLTSEEFMKNSPEAVFTLLGVLLDKCKETDLELIGNVSHTVEEAKVLQLKKLQETNKKIMFTNKKINEYIQDHLHRMVDLELKTSFCMYVDGQQGFTEFFNAIGVNENTEINFLNNADELPEDFGGTMVITDLKRAPYLAESHLSNTDFLLFQPLENNLPSVFIKFDIDRIESINILALDGADVLDNDERFNQLYVGKVASSPNQLF